ncbi:ATP-binding/permease protein CydD [Marinomonas aquimarina]|uniref:ATP-binding/permease protein CydD n=1 Tax=Marinomonas aquimarina TaxID=295068 RepID=A0A1A8TA95_9GAMM|nr:thiol reductant ABC exporter subunit CydD [Marinomonas aquimarina]SBS28615.1 ATP-binding/permease protein CydD [Marinomonas aquimarina]
MRKPVKTPEQQFLFDLQQAEKGRFQAVKWLGVLIALAIVAQALGLATVFAELVLEGRFPLEAAALAGGAFVLKAVLQFCREQICATASRNIRFSLRQRLIDHLTFLGPKRLELDEDAGLSTRVYEQVDALDDYFSRYVPQVFLVTFVPLTILFSVLPVSWIAFAIFAFTAPLVVFFMILVGHKAANANRKQFQVLSLLSNQFMDLNQGLAELKRLEQTDSARERLALTASEYQRTTMGVLRLAFLSTATLELFSSVAIAMVALYLGLGLLEQLPWQVGVAPVSLLAAFYLLLLAPEFYLPLRQLGNDYHAKQKAEAAATQIAEVLALTHADSCDLAATNDPAASAAQALPLIEFKALHWSNGGRVRLANLSAQINPRDRVWLRGHSGVGKSSLMAILLGFEQHFQGQFLIEGQPLRPTEMAAWRRRLAWLPQTPEWVQGTIRQNLELGVGHCTDDALRNALIKAQCWDFVGSLRFGWDTAISEAGTGLSGGQMQRLSIARALLSQADIWLLDEPCSSLDSETAEQVLNTLDEASYGKTVLIISHDTHPVIWANQQWLMTEEGVHVEAQTPITYV